MWKPYGPPRPVVGIALLLYNSTVFGSVKCVVLSESFRKRSREKRAKWCAALWRNQTLILHKIFFYGQRGSTQNWHHRVTKINQLHEQMKVVYLILLASVAGTPGAMLTKTTHRPNRMIRDIVSVTLERSEGLSRWRFRCPLGCDAVHSVKNGPMFEVPSRRLWCKRCWAFGFCYQKAGLITVTQDPKTVQALWMFSTAPACMHPSRTSLLPAISYFWIATRKKLAAMRSFLLVQGDISVSSLYMHESARRMRKSASLAGKGAESEMGEARNTDGCVHLAYVRVIK
jgi:hypothetical protein